MHDATRALESMLEASLELLTVIGRKHNPYNIRILEMFSSLYDMARDALGLIEKRRFLLVPLMLRSALDTLADLKLLLINPENVYHLEAQRLRRQKEMAQFEVDLDPSVLKAPRTDADIELANRYTTLSKDLDELVSKGYPPLSERAKFEKAGMADLHKTYFLAFSMETHNNPAALDARHLVRDESGRIVVIFDRQGTDEDFEMWTSLLTIIYIEATRVVVNLLRVEGRAILRKMIDAVSSHISPKYESILTFLGEQALG